ncbi:MAG: type II toxin-antitoxin system death-on-curing family toxin [Candidatus Doudnabacteria bacterium]|nr:type II toxin-antitoxin system death-on-curing family toxin [Candidatus Doudnabacteria bacterium]
MATPIKSISIQEVRDIAHHLAAKTMEWDEPIPQFESRFPGVLESCIVQPFQHFDKRLLYHGLIGKAAILFYLLIKNHPFQNGNKRIAVTTLLVFLSINGKWLNVDTTKLYLFAIWIAQSDAELKTEVVKVIERFITKNIVAY